MEKKLFFTFLLYNYRIPMGDLTLTDFYTVITVKVIVLAKPRRGCGDSDSKGTLAEVRVSL
jgi:hypothetical protein